MINDLRDTITIVELFTLTLTRFLCGKSFLVVRWLAHNSAAILLISMLPFVSTPDVSAEIPSELVIGVPSVRAAENLLRPTSEGDMLVSRAVLSPVLRVIDASRGRVSLVLLDSFSVDAQSLSWRLRLKPTLIFSNGQPIQGRDVCFSFNRCADLQGQQRVYDQCSLKKVDAESPFETVLVTASNKGEQSVRQQQMLELFSQCPIMEARSTTLFGADAGIGANLVAAGEYRIRSFVENRSYTLERYQRSLTSRSVPHQTLEIRAFNHQRDALSALRIGTISLHIGDLSEIEQQVRSDVTLRIGSCNGKSFVYRRGFRVNCPDGIDVARIEWDPSILENSELE
jgi:hypothetical protein